MKFVLAIMIALCSQQVYAQQWYAQEYNLNVDYLMAISGYQRVRPQDQITYQSPIWPNVTYTPTFIYPQQTARSQRQQRHLHWCRRCGRYHY